MPRTDRPYRLDPEVTPLKIALGAAVQDGYKLMKKLVAAHAFAHANAHDVLFELFGLPMP